MIHTFAVENYRSLLKVTLSLGQLNIITGANGSGKSNLYRSLRLLAETAQGGVVNSIAREGGLESTFWAGPETISRRMQAGEVPVQGGLRKKSTRLKLGFIGDEFGYSISLGLPVPSSSAFSLDPEIKKECIWSGSICRPASLLVDRTGAVVKVRENGKWQIVTEQLNLYESIFSQIADPVRTPDVLLMRDLIREWRFYDHFRTDSASPARLPQLGTRTPVLHNDGRDLAAALQTIREIGDIDGLDQAINDAFPGARVSVVVNDGRFTIEFKQEGLLRPLTGAELSDGTLRYLIWVAALLTPRPPAMMVLNEPETSLHPALLPALARLIIRASSKTQVWVVSHAENLIAELSNHPDVHSIELEKSFGQSEVSGQDLIDRPSWHWPD